MDIKNEVLYRVYFLLFGLIIPISILLLYKTVIIGHVEAERWRDKSKDMYVQYRPVEAERGNILAEDGSLLATSIPYFDIYMDPNSTGMTDDQFMDNLDSLSYCLATYVDNSRTVGGHREFLLEKRKEGARYLLLKKQVSYSEKKFIEQFPLFSLGQMQGGFIAEKRSERKRPFGLLAQRTIGYVREGAKPVGLEGYFDKELGGMAGKQLMIRVDRNQDIWLPLDDLTLIEPKSGDDIVTTLDINLQDITENALLRAMNYHDAEWGTAIVMDVKTGAIKAMANLGRTDEGFWETYNHAVGTSIEPGSTFKLASIMALLEDGYVTLEDSIDIEKGQTTFYEEKMEDSSPFSFKIDTTTVKRAFEISSNVGIAKLINQYYGKREALNQQKGAEKFIQALKDFNLHLNTGIKIHGEANPYIKEAYSEEDQWSGTTLPWMSIGYELKLTPLQLLNFFNAVANGGQMMQPYVVSEIQRFGETQQRFKPTVVKRSIASRKTIDQAQELLEAVVENGTAYKLKTDRYNFAGKTGTAQINYHKFARGGTRIGGYQASFIGYFPAEKPMYSCIVVINKPRQNGFYGSDVAGPVFREIADKCFISKIELHDAYNAISKPPLVSRMLPNNDVGQLEELAFLLDYLQIPHYGDPLSEMAILTAQSDSLWLERRTIPDRTVPAVVGMGLRDALFLLENRGLRVQVEGFGRVVRQSLRPGTKIQGQIITLILG